MDKDQRIVEPRNTYQQADWEVWLSSNPVGGPADGALNPLLFTY